MYRRFRSRTIITIDILGTEEGTLTDARKERSEILEYLNELVLTKTKISININYPNDF